MVVAEPDLMGVALLPAEAQTPLVVDSDTVLPRSIADQPLQTVARERGEIAQRARLVQSQELAVRGLRQLAA
jgi:hypothetical protein